MPFVGGMLPGSVRFKPPFLSARISKWAAAAVGAWQATHTWNTEAVECQDATAI